MELVTLTIMMEVMTMRTHQMITWCQYGAGTFLTMRRETEMIDKNKEKSKPTKMMVRIKGEFDSSGSYSLLKTTVKMIPIEIPVVKHDKASVME